MVSIISDGAPRFTPGIDMTKLKSMPTADRPRVVIIGAGFAGLAAARTLADAPVDVTVIDRRNHHLFQPLLYQVATAALAPTQIASPIRTILRRQANARVVLAEVTDIDVVGRSVVTGGRRTPYDYLVVATGATHAYFGHDGWAPHAPGLKSLEDAVEFRRRILTAFEAAETACDAGERAQLLTFVVVGGGPTGVELAGAIAELARRALMQDFRAIRVIPARVLLVEAGDRILPTFDAALSAYAKRALERLGVEVRLGAAVERCDEAGVQIGGESIAARSVFWAAGVRGSPAGRWLGVPCDSAGRVIVAPDLSLANSPEVFVIGDLARVADARGKPVPGVAPAAKQQGAHAGRVISDRVLEGRATAPFRYRDPGAFATVGREAAVASIGPMRLAGPVAWLLWSLAHVWFLIGFRNRLAVGLDWVWAYLTFERGSRLITGGHEGAPTNAHLAGRCACPSL
jgi:NADH dehydrogenase